jgi:hypothetical protein
MSPQGGSVLTELLPQIVVMAPTTMRADYATLPFEVPTTSNLDHTQRASLIAITSRCRTTTQVQWFTSWSASATSASRKICHHLHPHCACTDPEPTLLQAHAPVSVLIRELAVRPRRWHIFIEETFQDYGRRFICGIECSPALTVRHARASIRGTRTEQTEECAEMNGPQMRTAGNQSTRLGGK